MAKPGGSAANPLRELSGQISSTQRFGLGTAGIVLLTVLAGTFLIQTPWQERQSRLTSTFSEEQQRLELLQTLQSQRTTIRSQEKDFLLEGGAPVLTSQVSQLAKETGLEIESVTPQQETALQPYTKLQIEVIATASLQTLVRFLHSIEHHHPFLVVEEMGLGSQPPGLPQPAVGQETHQIRLLISSYARRENSA